MRPYGVQANMIKDAVLFSFDSLDVDTVTELVVSFSAPEKEKGKNILVLDVPKFCSEILGIEDTDKVHQLRILASRCEPDYKQYSEDKEYAFQEQQFWNSLFLFKWTRIKNSIRKFHEAKASTPISFRILASTTTSNVYFEAAIGRRLLNISSPLPPSKFRANSWHFPRLRQNMQLWKQICLLKQQRKNTY